MATKHTYSVATDFPGGKINLANLIDEIEASSIATALDKGATKVSGDVVEVWFKGALSAGDKTTLDGDASAPAGGLIAEHDSAPAASIQKVEVWNAPVVQSMTPEGPARVYFFSADLTKKQTWWFDAVKAAEVQIGTGDGVEASFQLPHGEDGAAGTRILDLHHGLVTEEDEIIPPGADEHDDAIPVVRVDAIVQTERSPFSSSGGDYTVDYKTGLITFTADSIPGDGAAVTAEYYAVPSNAKIVCKVRPSGAGKKLGVQYAEAQFSANVSMNGAIVQRAFSLLLGDTVPGTRPTVYKTVGNILDFNMGSLPKLPAVAGANGRGMTQETVLLPFGYLSRLSLLYEDEVELRIEIENGKEFGGERATFTLSGLEDSV